MHAFLYWFCTLHFLGWTREHVLRGNAKDFESGSGKKASDIYYFSPPPYMKKLVSKKNKHSACSWYPYCNLWYPEPTLELESWRKALLQILMFIIICLFQRSMVEISDYCKLNFISSILLISSIIFNKLNLSCFKKHFKISLYYRSGTVATFTRC